VVDSRPKVLESYNLNETRGQFFKTPVVTNSRLRYNLCLWGMRRRELFSKSRTFFQGANFLRLRTTLRRRELTRRRKNPLKKVASAKVVSSVYQSSSAYRSPFKVHILPEFSECIFDQKCVLVKKTPNYLINVFLNLMPKNC
jgi:hypothetical protein